MKHKRTLREQCCIIVGLITSSAFFPDCKMWFTRLAKLFKEMPQSWQAFPADGEKNCCWSFVELSRSTRNTSSYVGQSLPWCAYRAAGHQCLNARRQLRKQRHNVAVGLAAVRNFISILMKQGLSREWWEGEWNSLWKGPSRCEGPHSYRAHGCV